MLLLGILAVIQTVFLPGFIAINIFNIKTGSAIQKWIYVFAFSLFVNYALVTILTATGIYKVSVVLIIIAIEILIIIYLLICKKVKINLNISFRDLTLDYISFIKSLSPSGKVTLIIASTIILFYFSLIIANIGTIFYFVDTVNNIHWNTWAIDFSNNIFPKQSSHFPQLIPANWSLSYLIIGEPNVNFFPKSFMPLFFFSNLLMFLDLAISKKKYVYNIGLIIYGLFAPIIYNLEFMADGNGDLPVSFFAFLSFYSYLKIDKSKFNLKEYLIVFLFASTAAGTKLAGFYVFLFMSILCLHYLIKNYQSLNKKDILLLIFPVIFILTVNLFWYFLKPEVMAGGLDQPEWLAGGYINILKNALHLIYYNIGLPVLAFLIVTVLFSLLNKESRYVALFFVIPPAILWMFKYSSDFRNLSFVVPFLSYTSAFGAEKIYKLIKNSKEDLTLKTTNLKENISEKNIHYLVMLCFSISIIFYFIIGTDSFYQILYGIYTSINRYYFHSNRITYFTDFTFFVHVDYYQKVISTIFVVFSALSLFYIIKLKVRDVILILIITATFLNFTFVTKSTILEHQQNEFAKVDARNYYQTINTIVKTGGLNNLITTNFKPICSERIPRNIKFSYLSENKIINMLLDSSGTKSKILFIKLKNLNTQDIQKLKGTLSSKSNQALYDDGDYLLISTK
jgi:hypothetical protein